MVAVSPSADVVTETCATWQCLAMAVVSVASSTAVKTVLPSSTAYFLRSSVLTPAVQFLVIAAASSSSSDDVATDASVVTATCAVIRTVTRHLDVTYVATTFLFYGAPEETYFPIKVYNLFCSHKIIFCSHKIVFCSHKI